MVKDLRNICKSSPVNVTIFHPYFVFFDQFELVWPTTIQNFVIGALVMMVISFVFIPNFYCSLWISFSIISIEMGVVGYMSLWDVNLDSISMINLIMCIGFSIDFTAHICYVFMSSKCKRTEERVKEALYSLGLPIIQGASSTILGVVALLLAQSYIFLVFFKMVFLVIFFGAMHGLFLLPVLLSLLGPNSCSTEDDTESVDQMKFPYKDKKNGKIIHPFSITHPHLTLGSSPNGLYTSKQFMAATNFKAYGHEEKDLGIGTSSEDSSENSSSKSQKRKDDEDVRRRYEMGWRKSSQALPTASPCTFSPGLDIYGHKYEDLWNSTDNISNAKRDNRERSRTDLQIFNDDERDMSRNARRKSDFDRKGNEKLHYYDFNRERKSSDESYRGSDKDTRKPIKPRRNFV